MRKKCPNCNSKIQRRKLTEITDKKELIKYENCGAVLKTNNIYLFNKSAAPEWIGIFLIYFGIQVSEAFLITGWFLIVLGSGLYLYGLNRFLKSTRLKVIAVADKNPDNIFTGKNDQEGVSEIEEIQAYKKQFKLWSEERLHHVLTIKKWSKSAKIAAQELLNEK